MVGSSVKAPTAFTLYEGNLSADRIDAYPCTFACGEPSPLAASVSYNKRKKLAILSPSERLDASTTYRAFVGGAGGSESLAVKDRAGNPMATDYVWHFTTGAN